MPDAVLDKLAAQFRDFADHECAEDPLYVALCRAIADAPELLAMVQLSPAGQQRPNLLLAALHERVLAGADHPWREYYPSVGGTRAPDAALPDRLRDFAARERDALEAHLRQRSTQTNEIGRCAVLWPALSHLAERSGARDFALLDFGSSAGLNLGVDAYRYDCGAFTLGSAAADAPHVECRWLGAEPPRTDWRLVQRHGIDPSPIDVFDEAEVRWLRACLWPHHAERRARLDAAIAIARQAGRRVQHAADCIDAIEPWLASLPAGVQPVLFNSWVLAYLAPDEIERLRAVVTAHPRLAWISAERAALRPPGLTLSPAPALEDAQRATLWTLQWQGRAEALAWSHGHGHWCEWLGIMPAQKER